jgi:hypothetical protein
VPFPVPQLSTIDLADGCRRERADRGAAAIRYD